MSSLIAADLTLLDESLAGLKSVVAENWAPVSARAARGRTERPRLFCPIPSAVNTFVEIADLHAYDWVQRWGLISPAGEQSNKFRAARFSWLAARSYSTATKEQLKLVTDWIAFLFCYDDMCDTAPVGGGEHQRLLDGLEDRLIDIIHGAAPRAGDSALAKALADICNRVAVMEVDGEWMSRLAGHFRDYIHGVRWERRLRLRHETPSMATYTKMRPLISAVFPCFDFAAMFTPGLTKQSVDNAYARQLEMVANNHICMVNDIFGVEKEIREGTTCNVVLVLMQEGALSLSAAIDRAVELCNEELAAFFALQSDYTELAQPGAAGASYVGALRSWMRGNLDWYTKTKRYARTGHAKGPDTCWSVEL